MSNLTSKSYLQTLNTVGNLLVGAFHYIALFAIGSVIVWSAGHEFFLLFEKKVATIGDILLLFIYLELGAMIGIYFQTKRMPVRFLIYIAITALTRELVGIIQQSHSNTAIHASHSLDDTKILYLSGTILILALASLILRIGSYKYPSSSYSKKVNEKEL